MNLNLFEKTYVICRLPPDSPIPEWSMSSGFFSITRTIEEFSIVCEMGLVPEGVKAESGWRIFQVEGTLDFSLTGILASIANPLADAKVSIFAISTFDTDYVLVKQESLEKAREALTKNGFVVLN